MGSTDINCLSVSEYAGPNGEGKYRVDQRTVTFVSNDPRFKENRSDEYKEKLGPGQYHNTSSNPKGKIVGWGGWVGTHFEQHEHGFRWQRGRDRFERKLEKNALSGRPNMNPLSGWYWEDDRNVRIGRAERFPQPKSEEYKKALGPGSYELRLAHNKMLNRGKRPVRSPFMKPQGVPRTTRAFRHGDPGDLGPGSHDAVTPDEVSQSKYLSKPDPTILAHEIKNQPRVEREKRHGDPTGLGPGSYDWAKPRPRTADEPGRASSAFVGPGHGMDSFSSAHEGAAKNVEVAWNLAKDAKTWTEGGMTGVSGAYQGRPRFDVPCRGEEIAWRSEFTSRQQLLAGVARHEAFKRKLEREKRRKAQRKGKPPRPSGDESARAPRTRSASARPDTR